jgi:nucleolar protein 56
LTEEKLVEITEIVGDEEVSKAVLKAAKSSMGFDISEQDLFNVVMFTQRMISLAEYRKQVNICLFKNN